MASSTILNGEQDNSFNHARGVSQGDPLSPMLFLLVMDPLQHLLDMATRQGIITPLPLAAANWRTSLYVDDAAIFINLIKEDVIAIKTILEAFGNL
jgi:hypothetical protein